MSNLPKRKLGRTGLEVTPLGFGAMELRGADSGGNNIGPAVSDEDARAVLNAGINFIDTSIDYGHAEEHIGKHIAHRRSEYYLASKCGCVPNAARGAPTDWVKRRNYMVPGPVMQDRWESAKLDELRGEMSRMEFTLRFTLSNPDLDTTIVGTSRVEHLKANVAAAGRGALDADVYEEAKKRLAAVA